LCVSDYAVVSFSRPRTRRTRRTPTAVAADVDPAISVVVLIAVSGLPGTGKTTVARELAARLGAVHLSVDIAEDALLGAGLEVGWTTGVAAYEAVRAAAEQSLAIGLVVVVDAVNDSDRSRQTWRDAAKRCGVPLRFVVIQPPPAEEHQRRLESREGSFRHVPEPTWEQVRERARTYEPWSDERVEVAGSRPADALVQDVLAALELEP